MNPINDPEQLEWRFDHISSYLQNDTTPVLHHILGNISDIPKLITTILYKKLSPSTFVKLRATLRICFEDNKSTPNPSPAKDGASFIKEGDTPIIQELLQLGISKNTLATVKMLYDFLCKLLKSDEDVHEDMEYIADGYDVHIDDLRKIAYHSDDLLLKYQQELVQKTGVNNVKVKFVMNQ
jgi:DNA mismatch repair ATPase MutS